MNVLLNLDAVYGVTNALVWSIFGMGDTLGVTGGELAMILASPELFASGGDSNLASAVTG